MRTIPAWLEAMMVEVVRLHADDRPQDGLPGEVTDAVLEQLQAALVEVERLDPKPK